jgi:hypothetical protein
MSKSRYDRRPVNQYVLVPSPLGIKGVPSERFQFDIRKCTLRRNCWCYHWESCMRSIQCNVEFGYQLSICSGTKEDHGKPWSRWSAAGPSGCKLTSIQQSGIKYANPNTSPYLCFFFFENIYKLSSPKSSQCQSQKSKSRYDRRPVNQYVLVPSPLGIKGVPPEKFQFDIRRCTLRRNFWFTFHVLI